MNEIKPIKDKYYLSGFFSKVIRSEHLPVLIYALAFIIRMIFVMETDNKMFFSTLLGDPAYYDEWAKRITLGNVLGSEVWEMSPLYPYLLAFFYKVFGCSYLIVKFFQIILGSSTCLLVFYIGEKLFSRKVGLIAALLAVFTGVMIFFDGVIMKTSPGIFFSVLFVYLCILISGGKFKEKGYLFTGVELGFLCLLRENALALVLIPVVILLRSCKPGKINRERAVKYGLLFLLGLGLVVLPVTYRNFRVGKDFVLVTSKYGETFYEGNNPEADGTYSPPDFVRPDPVYEHADFTKKAEELTGRSLKPSQVSNYWLLQGVNFIVKHPVKWLGIQFKKLRYLFNTYEGPDNYDYYFSKQFSFLLSLPLITFGLIGPLAIVGMYFGMKEFRKLYPLYLYVLIYAFSILLFFIFSRFRIYMTPVLSIFAAYGLVSLAGVIKSGGWKGSMKPVVLLAGFLVVFHLPVHRQEFTGSYNSLGCVYSRNLMHREAVEVFEKAMEINNQMPELWFNLGNSHMDLAKEKKINREPEEDINVMFGKGHRFRGTAYFMYNRYEEALDEFKRSMKYAPGSVETLSYLGITYFYLNNYEEARSYLEDSLEKDPELSENRKALAMIYEGKDTLKAIRMWESYLENVPVSPENAPERGLISERIVELSK